MMCVLVYLVLWLKETFYLLINSPRDISDFESSEEHPMFHCFVKVEEESPSYCIVFHVDIDCEKRFKVQQPYIIMENVKNKYCISIPNHQDKIREESAKLCMLSEKACKVESNVYIYLMLWMKWILIFLLNMYLVILFLSTYRGNHI